MTDLLARLSYRDVAKTIDHSLLRPELDDRFVEDGCRLAAEYDVASATVRPPDVARAAAILRGTDVKVGTVVGFPHGNETPSMKEYQAKEVMDLGAEEIDMVMNIPALKNGEEALFLRDVEGVVQAAGGAVVKVITENCYLSPDEKRRACDWIARAGAHFVKTSTAYAAGGATLEDVRLMYEAVNGRCRVKAAGGIRELHEVLDFLRAGARRFGSTRTEQFVRAFRELPDDERAAFGEFASVAV